MTFSMMPVVIRTASLGPTDLYIRGQPVLEGQKYMSRFAAHAAGNTTAFCVGSSTMQMLEQFLKISHGSFIPRNPQFIIFL
jgi:hypothetical protein